MPSEVQIVIKVSQSGVEAFEKTAQGLERVKGTAKDANLSLTDIKSGFDILSRAVTESLTMIDQVNDLGVASLPAVDVMVYIGRFVVDGPVKVDWGDRQGFIVLSFQQLLDVRREFLAAIEQWSAEVGTGGQDA